MKYTYSRNIENLVDISKITLPKSIIGSNTLKGLAMNGWFYSKTSILIKFMEFTAIGLIDSGWNIGK